MNTTMDSQFEEWYAKQLSACKEAGYAIEPDSLTAKACRATSYEAWCAGYSAGYLQAGVEFPAAIRHAEGAD